MFSVEVETTLMCHYIGPLLAVLVKAQNNIPRGDVPEDPHDAVMALQAAASQYNEPSLPRFLPSRAAGTVSRDANEVSAEQFIDKYVTLTGLLAAYPGLSARIDLAELLTLLPKMRPRYYSISSSNLLSPTHVALTVGLVVETTPLGSVRRGVCSNFLCNTRIGSKVLASIRTSSFRLPCDQ
jgi:sulfite reductase alpha subunit-like flavoprotein